MFGFLKNLLGNREGRQNPPEAAPSLKMPEPPAAASGPVSPPQSPVASPSAPPVRAGGGISRPKGKMERLLLPLKAVTDRFSPELQALLAQPPAETVIIALSVETILEQLPTGRVEIPIGDLRRVSPIHIFVPDTSRDEERVALPLPQILAKLDPALLKRNTQSKVELPEGIDAIFARLGGAPASLPASLEGAVAIPPPSPVPAPLPKAVAPLPPAAPSRPEPELPKPHVLAAPPEMQALFGRSREPVPEPAAAPVLPEEPLTFSGLKLRLETEPESEQKPKPEEEEFEAPGLKLRMPPAPEPAPEVEPAPEPPVVTLEIPEEEAPLPPVSLPPPPPPPAPRLEESPVAAKPFVLKFETPDDTPEPARREITLPRRAIVDAPAYRSPRPPAAPAPAPAPVSAPLPAPLPAARTASPPVALPPGAAALVVIPLAKVSAGWTGAACDRVASQPPDAAIHFPTAELAAAIRKGKVALSWRQISTLLVPPLEEPLEASSDPADLDRPLELPLSVVAPLFMAAARPSSGQRVALDESIPDPFAKAQKTPTAAPASAAPKTGVPGLVDESLPSEIVQRACAFNGVAGSVIALNEGLLVAAQVPPEFEKETLAAFLPQVFSRVEQATGAMHLGDLQNLTFTAGNRPWQIWKAGALFFAVVGKPHELLPSAQLKILAAQLARQSKG